MNCVCGCDDAHMSDLGTPGGGPCGSCWHCDYWDSGHYANPREASTPGEAEYLENVKRRWW